MNFKCVLSAQFKGLSRVFPSLKRNSYNYPTTFERKEFTLKNELISLFWDVVFPPNGQYKLPTMPAEPIYDVNLGEDKFKTNKRMIDARGYEPIHTEV